MKRRRIVVTGLGAISPVGNNVNDSWNSIKLGRPGTGKITLFDASDYPVQIAAEVKNFSLDNYDIDKKISRKMNRQTKFLLASCIEAVEDAGYTKDSIGKEKAGIINGVGIGFNEAVETGYKKYCEFGVNRIPPLTSPLALNNEAAANVSMYFNIHGPAWTLSTACSSGTDSIGLSLDMIRSGRLDVCLACGSDANITGFNIGCYQVLQALTSDFNDNPEKASRPFDKNRSGFVMGEGAAVLILEELEHAK
ncbi:MAG: beta-ketoacyl-[acyl-carrier-protein] synthase family protein, partial [Treponema sp.]|nr:beta-ketoacyl-[acyl-carrier-protein] synthase family protein [Treponema sp.]